MSKTRILDFLGEKDLLLPALVASAIAANDRAKYLLALLQLAVGNADRPCNETPNLRAEREACGIADTGLDATVAQSEALGSGTYHIPGATRAVGLLSKAIDDMLAPLAIAAESDAGHRQLTVRRDRLFGALPAIEDDVVQGETIAALTSGRPASGDGVHLLVMDLHKEINRLQSEIAEEEIAGARVYGLDDSDRPLVAAFMEGMGTTAALKFDHPGLTTTAARSGEALLIQNDIGETDAHVLVVQVIGLTASLTYTDVHAQRLLFLQKSLKPTAIEWHETHSRQAAGLANDDLFYTVTGRLAAPDDAALKAFLEKLGSRLVFLIDWNRARKRLGLLVPNSLAVDLLEWAAERDLGHRAFLQLGGERLIYDALEQAVRTPLRYGEKLHQMIGINAAREYLSFVLEITATGLREGRSEALICDRIRAELFNHFRSAEQRLLAEGSRHAAIIVRLAQGLRDMIRSGQAPATGLTSQKALKAKTLESQADDIVRGVRSTVQRIAGTEVFRQIIEIADDAADELEEAAFLVTVAVNPVTDGDGKAAFDLRFPEPLIDLAELVLDGAQSFRRTLEAAPLIHRGGGREPIQNFLEAVDRVMTAEHQTDQRERDVTIALMATPIDARQLFLIAALTRHLEGAADSLMRASLTLRDHVMGEVMFE